MASTSSMLSRWILPGMLGVLIVLVFLSTLLAPSKSTQETLPNRSAYNAAETGTRAWYLAMQQSGVRVSLWEQPFAELTTLSQPTSMVIISPYTYSTDSAVFSPKEAEQLMGWVAQGNTLILLDDFRRAGSGRIARAARLQVRVLPCMAEPARRSTDNDASSPPRLKALPLKSLQPSLNAFVRLPLLSRSNVAFRINAPVQAQWSGQLTPLLVDGDGNPRLVRLTYGRGALILGTVWDLVDNAFLHAPLNDNDQFLTNLLRQEGKPVYLNEFVHGYAPTEDIYTYFGHKTPLGPIFAQLVLGFVLLLWLSLLRWTPKPSEGSRETVKSTEATGINAYIQSMAQWYARTHASSLVLAPQVRRIETLLRQRFRLTLDDEDRFKHLLAPLPGHYSSRESSPDARFESSPEALPEALIEALRLARAQIQEQGPSQGQALRQTQLTKPLSDRALLQLARQLTLIEERLHHERQCTHLISR